MSNTIKIKRGADKPDGKLAPYELGIDVNDGQLYYGGPLDQDKSSYGDALGLKVAQANMLSTSRKIKVDLSQEKAASFNGQEDITTGVEGILPISKGGTGSADVTSARTALGITPGNIGAAPSSHTHDYLPLNGGTLTGSLNLANGTWNAAGDDAYFGDANIGGSFCIKGKNDNTRLTFFPSAKLNGITYPSWIFESLFDKDGNHEGLRLMQVCLNSDNHEAVYEAIRFNNNRFILINNNMYGTNLPESGYGEGAIFFQVVN